jgi:hypothetical protein
MWEAIEKGKRRYGLRLNTERLTHILLQRKGRGVEN